jgi:hypothetical protein
MLNIYAYDYDDKSLSTRKFHIYDMLDILIKEYDYKTIDIKLLYDSKCNDIFLKEYNRYPDNIIVLKGGSSIQKFKTDRSIKLTMIIDDIHHGGTLRQCRSKSLKRIHNVFCTYAYFFNHYYVKRNYNLYWLPHSARFTSISFNNKPINKIFVSGRLNHEIYPNRKKILSLNNKDVKYFRPNVGYRYKEEDNMNKKIFGEKYITKLSEYLCCFTCDANPKRPYIVAKHFEILSSGSLLLACNPHTKEYFKSLGFNDMEHYISCTPDNMKKKIAFILNNSNRDEINIIRKNGFELVKEKHNYLERTKFLHNILNNLELSNEYDVYRKFM